MTRQTFDWSRFCNYARWDFTVYSRFYRRMCLLMLGTMMSIVLLVYLVCPAFMSFSSEAFGKDPVYKVAVTMLFLAGFFTVVAMAYTFHCMLTRQSRILELTIPASTLERFVWHVLVVTLGTQLVLCVSIALADLLHMALAFAMGIRDIWPVWMRIYVQDARTLFYDCEIIQEMTSGWQGFVMLASFLCEMSFLMMVSAWKYRYTVLFAIVLKMVLGLVEAFVLGCMFGFGLLDSKKLVNLDFSAWAVASQVVILLVEVGLAYWLFSRAQVISRSNP